MLLLCWAAWYSTWLLIKLMPKGVVFSAVAVSSHSACTKRIADFKGEQHCRAYKSRPAQPYDAHAVQCLHLIRLCNLFPAGSEEVILPDFGEGFGNSDGMLLGASPLS